MRRRCCGRGSTSACTSRLRSKTIECRAGCRVVSVIVVLAGRLQELQDLQIDFEELAGNDWANDKTQEYNEHEEVEHRKSDNPSPS